jgi:hypothetical protein
MSTVVVATTISHLKNAYHDIEKLFNDSLPSVLRIPALELAINAIIDSLIPYETSRNNFKPTRVVNLLKQHIYISKEYKTIQGNIINVTLVKLHITVHPSGKKGIISTPDLKVINLDATPSGTKGVSAAMKAFVTND